MGLPLIRAELGRMTELHMNPALQLLIAAVFNIAAIFFLKRADGLTVSWPMAAALVLIGLTQLFISRAMASGASTGVAITAVVVSVMVGAAVIGAAFGEPLSMQRMVGLLIAVLGVVIASMA